MKTAVLLLLASLAASADPAPTRKVALPVRACRRDAEALCSDAEPDAARVLRCLRAHSPELTKPCKRALASKGRKTGDPEPRTAKRD